MLNFGPASVVVMEIHFVIVVFFAPLVIDGGMGSAATTTAMTTATATTGEPASSSSSSSSPPTTAPPEAYPITRKKVGPGEDSDIHGVPTWLWTSMWVSLGLAVIFLIVWGFYIIFRDESASKKVCYLCKKKVPHDEWNSGDHRKKCAKSRQGYLENLEKPYDIRCPMCNRKLGLWPDDKMGQVFTCDQAEDCLSAVMGEILNDGANRFTCFHCDFNLCRTCVRKNLKRLVAAGGNLGSRTPSNISAASSMANINIYDNPTLNPAQAISRSRQGSKVWERHSSMRDSRRLHHQQLQLAERLSNTSTINYDMDLGATAATMATGQQTSLSMAAPLSAGPLTTAGGFMAPPMPQGSRSPSLSAVSPPPSVIMGGGGGGGSPHHHHHHHRARFSFQADAGAFV